MALLQVTHVHKHGDSFDEILSIGNADQNWCLNAEKAKMLIEQKAHVFFIQDSRTGAISPIGVYHHHSKHQSYLCSYLDGMWNDWLLRLPDFPDSESQMLREPQL